MAEPISNDRPTAQGYILLHVFAGPLIAVVTMFAIVIVTAAPTFVRPFQFNPRPFWEIAHVLVGICMAAWFIGFLPAIMHAATMLMLHRLLGTTVFWFLLTPFVGWIFTFLPMLILAGTDPDTFSKGGAMAMIGSAAALGCLAIAWLRGIYPVRL